MQFWPACLFVYGISLALTSTLAISAPASENERVRYKWKDEKGALHFSDTLTQEATKFGYDVVNTQGMVVKHVDRAKTPGELKAAKEEAQQKAKAKREAEEQAKADRQLLAAYPTEKMFNDMQKAYLSRLEQVIQSEESTLSAQEKSLTEQLSRAAELERDGKPIPVKVTEQINTLRADIAKQKSLIARKKEEKEVKVKNIDVELNHYREISTKLKVGEPASASGK